MTKPGVPESSDNTQTVTHSHRDPDPIQDTEPAGSGGSDLGGPPTTGESATENALTGTTTAGADDEDPDEGRQSALTFPKL